MYISQPLQSPAVEDVCIHEPCKTGVAYVTERKSVRIIIGSKRNSFEHIEYLNNS
jgi:hypothetical protein